MEIKPDKSKLEEFYNSHSCKETASYFGVCKVTIWKWCKSLGIKKARQRQSEKLRKLKKSKYRKTENYLLRRREYRKRYNSTEKGRIQRKRETLKHLYSISLEDYNRLLENQNGKCAICNADSPGHAHKYFCVDHDHSNNKNRGLLCHRCNRGMGFFKDDVELLEKVIEYIKKYKENYGDRSEQSL